MGQTEKLFMQIPEGVRRILCKLKNGIYSLKQSAIIWYKTIKEQLQTIGFPELHSESCVFIYQKSKKKYLIFCLYVDDILIATRRK